MLFVCGDLNFLQPRICMHTHSETANWDMLRDSLQRDVYDQRRNTTSLQTELKQEMKLKEIEMARSFKLQQDLDLLRTQINEQSMMVGI